MSGEHLDERWPWPGELEPVGCADCAREALRRFWPGPLESRPQLNQPADAAAVLLPLLQDRDREACLLVALDSKHRLLDLVPVSVGSVDHTFMAPREIFRDALLHGAAAIMVAHNHPSGDPTPSPEDRAITRRLTHAGSTLGITVLDHLIVGGRDWISLAQRGAM